jgi:hypothetical protein
MAFGTGCYGKMLAIREQRKDENQAGNMGKVGDFSTSIA